MRTPDHIREAVIVDYAAGMLHKDVAEKYGLGRATISRIIAAAGVRRPREAPAEALATAAADYIESGDPAKVVAKRHEISENALRVELKKRGLTRPSGNQFNAATRRAVVADYANGLPMRDITQQHGVSATAVLAWARSAGVEIRKPGYRHTQDEPIAYEGGWVLVNGVKRPTHPVRRVAA
jgi:transposase-like protein